MANSRHITRRSAIVGLATSAVAVSVVAQATGGESEILTLFREWDACYQAGFDKTLTDEYCSVLTERMVALEERITSIPATTMQELAAKMIADTSYGDFCLGDGPNGERVLAEAQSLVASI